MGEIIGRQGYDGTGPVPVGYGYPPAYASAWGLAPVGDAAQLAQGEIKKALMGVPLAAVTAEPHSPVMMAGAADPREAAYRAAYWLAVGSRILQGRGQRSSALTSAATAAWTRGNLGGGVFGPLAMLTPTYWMTTTGGDPQTRQVLSDAAGLLERSGVPEVGRILRQQATPGAMQVQQKATEGQGWDAGVRNLFAAADPRPPWMKTKGFQIGMYGVGGLLALGLFAALLRWSIGPYVRAGRGVARAARRR